MQRVTRIKSKNSHQVPYVRVIGENESEYSRHPVYTSIIGAIVFGVILSQVLSVSEEISSILAVVRPSLGQFRPGKHFLRAKMAYIHGRNRNPTSMVVL